MTRPSRARGTTWIAWIELDELTGSARSVTPAASSVTDASSTAAIARTRLRRGPLELIDLALELADVTRLAVHRCEAHVGHLVDAAELVHDEGADVGGLDFTLRAILELGFNPVGDALELLHA